MTIDEQSPLPVRRMILRDRSQMYFNMLNCIHSLSQEEREKITGWMILTDEELATLPLETDDEVAFYPETL